MEFFSALNACLKNLRGIYRLLWIIKLRYILSPNNFIHHRIVIFGLAPSILILRKKGDARVKPEHDEGGDYASLSTLDI